MSKENCNVCLARIYEQIEQKDQRIAELEKENKELKNENNEFCDYNKKLREEKQTAVKEFADEILNMWSNYSAKEESDIFSFYYHFQDNILELLKEMGIE